MNHTQYRNRARRNQLAFPSFANMINEIMNAPLHSMVKEKKVHTTTPAINVLQDDKKYSIEMAIPGYHKKDINIEVKDNKLTISSDVDKSTEDAYRLREFVYGPFSRTFNLPKDANQSEIKAKVANGILVVTIAKQPEPEPVQIVVK